MIDPEGHGWNHAQCMVCWLNRWGLERVPVRLTEPREETCCYCGSLTESGIYVRAKPASLEVPYCVDTWKTPPPFLPDPPGVKS